MPLIEMRALRDAGLAPMEVIEAGTRTAGRVCGQEDDLGTLEVGKLADIIVVDGNPLVDLDALSSLSTIVVGGEVVRWCGRELAVAGPGRHLLSAPGV